ncbi:MAG: hypothetical protein WA705_12175 [Candidatus Ozemobacteraceae bacterium]
MKRVFLTSSLLATLFVAGVCNLSLAADSGAATKGTTDAPLLSQGPIPPAPVSNQGSSGLPAEAPPPGIVPPPPPPGFALPNAAETGTTSTLSQNSSKTSTKSAPNTIPETVQMPPSSAVSSPGAVSSADAKPPVGPSPAPSTNTPGMPIMPPPPVLSGPNVFPPALNPAPTLTAPTMPMVPPAQSIPSIQGNMAAPGLPAPTLPGMPAPPLMGAPGVAQTAPMKKKLDPRATEILRQIIRGAMVARDLPQNPHDDAKLRKLLDVGPQVCRLLGLAQFPIMPRFQVRTSESVIRDRSYGAYEYRQVGAFQTRLDGWVKPVSGFVHFDLSFIARGRSRVFVKGVLNTIGAVSATVDIEGYDAYGRKWQLRIKSSDMLIRDDGLPAGGKLNVSGMDPANRSLQFETVFPIEEVAPLKPLPEEHDHRHHHHHVPRRY